MNSKVPSNEDTAKDTTPKQRETAKTNATLLRSVMSKKKHETAMARHANDAIAKADEASNMVIA